MHFNKKKGYTPMDIPILAIVLVVATISLSLGGTVLSSIQTGQTVNTYAYNITGYGLSGLNTMGQYLPTIAVVIAAAVVIGILLYSFKFGKNGND